MVGSVCVVLFHTTLLALEPVETTPRCRLIPRIYVQRAGAGVIPTTNVNVFRARSSPRRNVKDSKLHK